MHTSKALHMFIVTVGRYGSTIAFDWRNVAVAFALDLEYRRGIMAIVSTRQSPLRAQRK